MEQQTELIKTFINPIFLEAINQPISSIYCSWSYSFVMNRKGGKFRVTLYNGKDGQISICSNNDNMLGNPIIQDYCQTLDDFVKLIEKLDDLIEHMPWINKSM